METTNEMVTITVEKGTETLTLKVPAGKAVRALVEGQRLTGLAVMLNGRPVGTGKKSVDPSTPVKDGDCISTIPKSGEQG